MTFFPPPLLHRPSHNFKFWHMNAADSCHLSFLRQPRQITVTCAVSSACRLFPFAFEREGGQLEQREGGGLPWKTNISVPANLQMAPVFIQLRIGQQPEHHCGRLLLPRHMWGQYVEICVWYMTNEMVLNSGGAGKAWLDDVQPVWLRVRGGTGAPWFCQDPSTSNHHVGGIAFTDIYVIKTWHKNRVMFCYLHYCWTKLPLTKGWISTLVCSDHLSVSKMLISLKAAAFRLESLCILHAKICISHFSFIFNPRVSNLHHPNSINPVIIQYTGFKNCKCYIHLSSFTHFMWPRPWSDKTR